MARAMSPAMDRMFDKVIDCVDAEDVVERSRQALLIRSISGE